MKIKLLAYFFVLLYLIAMLRPIAPFVEYTINYDYISKILCINKEKVELGCKGKCYVMKQLKKQQEDDYNSLQISMKDYPIGFVKLLSIKDIFSNSFLARNLLHYTQNYSFLADFSVFHPPKY